MILKYLRRGGTKVAAMLRQSVMQHTLWQAGEQRGLEGPFNHARGWSGILLGRLHIRMTQMNLTLKGPKRETEIPVGREGDCLLAELAGADPAARAINVNGIAKWESCLSQLDGCR